MAQDFTPYRDRIIGQGLRFSTPYGSQELLYADWTASGRLYAPIEAFLSQTVGPLVANTHTETSFAGATMTAAYHEAQAVIKRHVRARPTDVILFCGFGMTAAVNKLQRMLGLRVPETLCDHSCRVTGVCPLRQTPLPVVYLTHLEHHSNQTSWNECCVEVRVVPRGTDGLPDQAWLEADLAALTGGRRILASFSACSNVTGLQTPHQDLARIIHRHGGVCFVDFAASGPYVDIDLDPPDPACRPDAIFFSPHKFLGGPGSSGVLLFDRALYHNKVPDQPGGGTVLWTNPWGEQNYYEDIELREDGGTPGFLQAIRASLAVLLKEDMGTKAIQEREHVLVTRLLDGLAADSQVRLLEPELRHRLGIVSFWVPDIHFNLMVRLLSDRFGIQVRGGCSCAGTYGHILLDVTRELSRKITETIDRGDLSLKPGWVRISLHPVMTEAEVDRIVEAVRAVIRHHRVWSEDYRFDPASAEWRPLKSVEPALGLVRDFRIL
jgi:selenocysteine lyase/cysteine desulfurase